MKEKMFCVNKSSLFWLIWFLYDAILGDRQVSILYRLVLSASKMKTLEVFCMKNTKGVYDTEGVIKGTRMFSYHACKSSVFHIIHSKTYKERNVPQCFCVFPMGKCRATRVLYVYKKTIEEKWTRLMKRMTFLSFYWFPTTNMYKHPRYMY